MPDKPETSKCPLEPWTKLDYNETQRWRCVGEVEEAWAKDDHVTNYRLKDTATVVFKHGTIADGDTGIYVPPGATGRVTYARTPRVKRRGGKGSLYFANVRVMWEGKAYTARVPHSALRIS